MDHQLRYSSLFSDTSGSGSDADSPSFIPTDTSSISAGTQGFLMGCPSVPVRVRSRLIPLRYPGSMVLWIFLKRSFIYISACVCLLTHPHAQVQILSHQSKIATQIELFVGHGDSYESAHFRRLGYLSLNSNERSKYQARELKSVYVNAPGQYLRMLVHKCYINEVNLFNQVGAN